MSMFEIQYIDIGECNVVLEVFYKANLKDTITKHLWITIYLALHNCLEDPSLWRLSVTGVNSLLLGVYTPEASPKFFSTVMHELNAKGLIFRDENARGWVNDMHTDSDPCSLKGCLVRLGGTQINCTLYKPHL